MATTYESDSVAVFNSLKCFAYPSANAQNQGQLNSEENIRWIMLRLTKRSFTLTQQDFALYKKSTDEHIFVINAGKANIDGYYFYCSDETEIDLDSENFMTPELVALLATATSPETAIKLYVKFEKNTDSADHLLTYSTDTTTQTISKFEGFKIILTDKEPSVNEFYLGYLTVYKNQGETVIDKVVNNIYKCMFLNSSNIYVDDNNLGNEERTINNLIKYLINSILGKGIDSDIVCYGPDPGNHDGTSNMFICNKQMYTLSQENENDPNLTPEEKSAIIEAKKKINYLRLYYNPTTKIGGLQIVKSLDFRTFDEVPTDDLTDETDPKYRINILSCNLNVTENSSPSFNLYPMYMKFGKENGNIEILGNFIVDQNINVAGNYESNNGNITLKQGNITANVITGKKVFGAVWN